MAVRPQAKVAVDIADSSIRALFLQALSRSRINPSLPGEEASVIVKDGFVDKEPPDKPVVQLWRMGRARKNTGLNPFASTVARNWIGTSPTIRGDDVSTTIAHLFEQRFIGLQQLMPNPKEVVTLVEKTSTARGAHLAQLHAFLEKHRTSRHLNESMEFAFEEMFSNAAYNAPVDAAGVHVHSSKSRSQSVISERPFIIEYRVDAEHVGLSIRDAYGTLGADRMLDCLRRCYSQGGAQFEEKAGGAGLGFFMMLQQATRLVVNVKAGQFSEFIVLRRLNESRREFMMSTPTLNLCFVTADSSATTSRRYSRTPVRWPARVLVGEVERAATILDISPGGAFLVIEGGLEGFTQNSELTIVSSSATRRPIAARAQVRWVGMSNAHRGAGLGVEFIPPLNENDFDEWEGS